MAITPECGPHCGIAGGADDTITREGHCDCGDLCHPPGHAPPSVALRRGAGGESRQPLSQDGQPLHGVPMCARWYELAGDHRPWDGPHVIRDVTLVSWGPSLYGYEDSPPSTLANADQEAARREVPEP
jgi:hypothetical protein